jgi:hypothetical protein
MNAPPSTITAQSVARMTRRRTDADRSDPVWWAYQLFVVVPVTPLEFFLGCLSMVYGGWLLLPGCGYCTSAAWTVFVHMRIPEPALGALLFVPGALQAWFAYWPGSSRIRLAYRLGKASVLVFLWTSLATGFFLAVPSGLGVWSASTVAFAQLWVATRVGRRPRHA